PNALGLPIRFPGTHMRPSSARPGPAPRDTVPTALDDPSTLDVEAVARMLEADLENGLSAGEAARRLARDGPNELRAAPPTPSWPRMLAQFEDPLIYLLLAAIVIGLLAWRMAGRDGWPGDAIVIGLIVMLSGLLGYAQEARARDAVAALSRMTAATSA